MEAIKNLIVSMDSKVIITIAIVLAILLVVSIVKKMIKTAIIAMLACLIMSTVVPMAKTTLEQVDWRKDGDSLIVIYKGQEINMDTIEIDNIEIEKSDEHWWASDVTVEVEGKSFDFFIPSIFNGMVEKYK